jgi:hypothetical protein
LPWLRQALDKLGFCVLSRLHDDPTVAATLGRHHAGRVTRRRRPTTTTGLSALGALATPQLLLLLLLLLFGSIVVRILPLAVRDATTKRRAALLSQSVAPRLGRRRKRRTACRLACNPTP